MRVSPWYRVRRQCRRPIQPGNHNAVAEVATDLPADRVFAPALHAVERTFGRVARWPMPPGSSTWICWIFAAKPRQEGPAGPPCPPGWRRAFVLRPLADLEPMAPGDRGVRPGIARQITCGSDGEPMDSVPPRSRGRYRCKRRRDRTSYLRQTSGTG